MIKWFKDVLIGSATAKKSIRNNSWFAGSHLSLKQIVKLIYYWVYKLPQSFVEEELRIGSCTTLVDWLSFAREVCLQIAISDKLIMNRLVVMEWLLMKVNLEKGSIIEDAE